MPVPPCSPHIEKIIRVTRGIPPKKFFQQGGTRGGQAILENFRGRGDAAYRGDHPCPPYRENPAKMPHTYSPLLRKLQMCSVILKYISKCVALIARLTLFLLIPTKTMFLHLESVRTVRNFISSPTSVKKSKIFGEKMKNKNLGCIEKHVQMCEC